MPQIRQLAKEKSFLLSDIARKGKQAFVTGDRLKRRNDTLIKAATKISKTPHRSALIPYILRSLLDHQEKRKLTGFQEELIRPILQAGLADRVLKRFKGLPDQTAKAFDANYFKVSETGERIDDLLKNQILQATKQVETDISKSAREYTLIGGFGNTTFTSASGVGLSKDILAAFGILSPVPACPPVFQLDLEYRGITTHKVHDKSNGVEPYLITSFYRIPHEIRDYIMHGDIPSVMHEMTSPMKIEQIPKNLGQMSAGYWMPSGGHMDSLGNPSNPIQFHPKMLIETEITVFEMELKIMRPINSSVNLAPLLHGQDSHFAVISVWEEDGDQSFEIMKNFTNLVGPMGATLLALYEVPFVALGLVIIDLLIELVRFISGNMDDHIGEIVLFFDKSDLEIEGYREIPFRINNDDNEWTIFIGVESKRLR
jgi:hypothetical protein